MEEEGVLCLKWRDHRSTFLRMLSSTRKKGAFCDATLVCEGKFYPVHQLVLSTCSEYFQRMFEEVGTGAGRTGGSGTAARAGPIHAMATPTPLLVVLAGVCPRDLEALLEYMYAGEATILQGDLAHFMRAAEGLKIRGLAEPTSPSPSPDPDLSSPREASERNKRPLSYSEEDSVGNKRKKESFGSPRGMRSRSLSDIVSPAQLAAVELAPESQGGVGVCVERDMATGTPGDLPGAVLPLSPTLIHPQVKYEDVLVKDEPQHMHEEEEEEEEDENHEEPEDNTDLDRDWKPRNHSQRHHHYHNQNQNQTGTRRHHHHNNHNQQQQHHNQHQHQIDDGVDAAQLLGFCDPGLTYLAHSSLTEHSTLTAQPSVNIHPRRMGRPTSEIWLHYTIDRMPGKTVVYCRYCNQKYGYPNATKMKIHTMKCSQCPEEVKRQFEAGTTTTTTTTTAADTTMGRLGLDLDAGGGGGGGGGGVGNTDDSTPQYHQLHKGSDADSGSTVKPDSASAAKSKHQRGYQSPEKSATTAAAAAAAAAASKVSGSSPDKALADSNTQHQYQHQQPLSRQQSDRIYHHPVY